MYSDNIVNFQESTAILNASTKKVWKLFEGTTYFKTLQASYQRQGLLNLFFPFWLVYQPL